MWNELETLVKTHAGDTDRHQRVLDCIIACRSKPPEEEERKKRGRKREEKEDRTEKNGSKDTDDKSWQDSERSVDVYLIIHPHLRQKISLLWSLNVPFVFLFLT